MGEDTWLIWKLLARGSVAATGDFYVCVIEDTAGDTVDDKLFSRRAFGVCAFIDVAIISYWGTAEGSKKV